MMEDIKKEESPYCETCGHCGEIGCCGIESFIEKHIKGKTNCKNEALVIDDIIALCSYETDVLKENDELEKYKNAWEELYSEKEMPCSIEYMQSLEEKYNLGSDKDVKD